MADYYIEDGYKVFTEEFHLKRGTCCGSGCRHCPFPKEPVCDECEQPATHTIRDASLIKHHFCAEHWDKHVELSGNDGKPYGFG